jgi:hypothetical protein
MIANRENPFASNPVALYVMAYRYNKTTRVMSSRKNRIQDYPTKTRQRKKLEVA